jgi:hypothetical protein
LKRNPLKRHPSVALHAVLFGTDHNIHLLLKKLALLFTQIRKRLLAQSLALHATSQTIKT